jgi:microcystin degradation protein MlrC
VPIAASLDLHANVSPEFAHTAHVLTALRTAPHVDGDEVRDRAVRHLVRCVREGIRPANVLVKLPLILPGEYAVTEEEPARSLYARLREIETRPGIIDASLLIGCAWTDSPYTAVSVIVVAESDPAPAAEAARSLATEVWSRRGGFGPEVETVLLSEAVALAMATSEGPVVIADSGDNVTAGAAGDIPLALGALIRAGAESCVVCPLADPESVDRCAEVGEGALVRLAIGGKLDRATAKPLEVEALVLRVTEDLAAVRIGGVEAVLTRERRGSYRMDTYEKAGIDPRERHIVVAKQGYLPGELRALARRTIMATTPGATSLVLSELPYERLTRPIYPLDEDAVWEDVTGVRARP